MRKHPTTPGQGTARRFMTLAAALGMAVAAGGCDSLLEVDNPNNVVQEDLEAAGSVNALVNGALAETTQAIADAVQASIVVSDEAFWVGSQNALRELDNGELLNLDNDYSPFPDFSESRWLSAEAVKQAELFAGDLPRPIDRARAHLYLGVNYASIADLFDDFVFSDRTEASPPIGEANMVQLYDDAVDELTAAIDIARSVGNTEVELRALGMRARAHWAKALWQKLNPAGSAPADPYINSAEANADARALLDRVTDNPDWAYTLQYSNASVTNSASSNMTQRLEFRVHQKWAQLDPTNDKKIARITYPDIVEDIPSTTLVKRVTAFIDGGQFSDIQLVSARELRLILAEAAFAAGNTGEAVAWINANRALDGLAPYSVGVNGVSLAEALEHERIVNLFFMAQRRWADLYRFDEEPEEWISAGPAASAPGTFFPIHRTEQISNCYILGTCG